MLLHCNSKKCNTTREHKLKVEGNEAICMECGEVNEQINAFMKSAMKSNGDLFKSVKAKKAFTFKCSKCGIDRGVKIIDEEAVCEICQHPMNLSLAMLNAVKLHLSNNKAENTDVALEKSVKKKKSGSTSKKTSTEKGENKNKDTEETK